tara:strand:+ start:1 stop:1755 length:1755 start_codon:yes stop_codon:yes gene_type:complete
MAPNQFKAQLGEIGALQTVGEAKQQQSQTALDEAFRQYQLEKDEPYNVMGKYQAVIQGAPVQQTTFAPTGAYSQPAPSTAQTLLGGIGTLSNAYGMFSGNTPKLKEGGMIYAEGGGGLNSLPVVYRKDKGKVSPYDTDPEFGYDDKGFLERVQDRIDSYKFSRRAGNQFPMENEGQGEPVFPLTQGRPIQLDEEAAKLYDKYGNLLDLPDTIDEFGNVIKKVSSNLYNKSQQKSTVDNAGGLSDIGRSTAGTNYLDGSVYKMNAIDPGDNYGGDSGVNLENPNQPTDVEQPKIVTPPSITPTKEEVQVVTNAKATLDAVATSPNATETDIAIAEKAYLDSIEMSKTKLAARQAGIEDQRKRAQYNNMAQFFARLGSASPRKEGILGLIDVGLQVAPESLDKMKATNEKAVTAANALIDKQDDLNRIKLKEDLGIKLSRNERKIAEEKVKREVGQFEESLNFKYKELDSKTRAAIAKAINDGGLKASDFNSVKGTIEAMSGKSFIKDKNGNYSKVDGIELTDGQTQQINSLMGEALATLADVGNLSDFNSGIAKQLAARMNDILTVKTDSSLQEEKQTNSLKYGI